MEQSKSITYKIFFLQPTTVYTLFSNKRHCYVNMLGRGLLSYEHYQEQRQKKERHNFNVGLLTGGELELSCIAMHFYSLQGLEYSSSITLTAS